MRATARKLLNTIAKWQLQRVTELSVGPSTVVNFRQIGSRPPSFVSIGAGSMTSCSIVGEQLGASVEIGRDTFIGGSNIICAGRIVIGNNVLISWGCTIIDHSSHSTVWRFRSMDVSEALQGRKDWTNVLIKPVFIHDMAWIGFDSIILPGVTVGTGAIVGAGSLVSKDVPPYHVVGGRPARIIRELRTDER